MKFSDKLFFAATSVLTLIFAVFGIWVLSSFFQKLLNRELEQGSTESQMFQYMFEMAYKSVPREYGVDYILNHVTESVMSSLAKEGNEYYIFDESSALLYGRETAETEERIGELRELQKGLNRENSYGSRISGGNSGYFLLASCLSENDGKIYYLALCKDISAIYEDRQVLLNQYRFVLVLLLLAGSAAIYALSRYITEPVRRLTRIAGRIAQGETALRSKNTSGDEIGELARSFNRMADELVERMEEKELEARQKEDFTAAFAHELKTPLTSIIGYADMLSTMQLSEAERSEAAYYIFTQGKRLESLSHKLLELVGVDRQDFRKLPIAVKDLEENIRSTMRPAFERRGIRGKVSLEKARIFGDKDLLLSLLYNLMDNAAKAVDKGGFILMKGIKTQAGYEIKVIDNGRGIPEEEISRITEAFYMVDKSRSRREGGAGIGMALCRKIIAMHGGTMQITSRLGEGTVVRVFLPTDEPLENGVLERAPEKRSWDAAKEE